MGVSLGLRARDKSLEELTFKEGLVPGTKPFQSVFTQKEIFPGTDSLKCLHEETCARFLCTILVFGSDKGFFE